MYRTDGMKEYRQVAGYEGGNGVGVEVRVLLPDRVELSDAMRRSLLTVGYEAYKAVQRDVRRNDPKEVEARRREAADIRALFDAPVFVEEVTNEYSLDGRPWFVVTTKVGRVKVGWRKRVISIDWSGSTVDRDAHDLFPDEDVTKVGRLIHAWGYEKAREYLKKIVG
jgi:hypothetical protein